MAAGGEAWAVTRALAKGLMVGFTTATIVIRQPYVKQLLDGTLNPSAPKSEVYLGVRKHALIMLVIAATMTMGTLADFSVTSAHYIASQGIDGYFNGQVLPLISSRQDNGMSHPSFLFSKCWVR